MEKERITISIKKSVLDQVDQTIDGSNIRNRSHAFESLVLKSLGSQEAAKIIVLMGGDDALKYIGEVEQYIEQIRKAGFLEVTFATGFLHDKVMARLGDGTNYNLNFIYDNRGEGSGGAILSLKKELKNTFIVINPRHHLNLDLKKLLKFHRTHGLAASVATDNLTSMEGIYIFEPEVLPELPKGFSMLEDDLLPRLIKEQKVAVCPVIK